MLLRNTIFGFYNVLSSKRNSGQVFPFFACFLFCFCFFFSSPLSSPGCRECQEIIRGLNAMGWIDQSCISLKLNSDSASLFAAAFPFQKKLDISSLLLTIVVSSLECGSIKSWKRIAAHVFENAWICMFLEMPCKDPNLWQVQPWWLTKNACVKNHIHSFDL